MAKIELHPITKELMTAIDGAFAVSPFADTIMVNASEAEDEFGLDRIKIENNYVWIAVDIDRQTRMVKIYGCMKYVPGTQIVKLMRFKGELVLDFSMPETKVDGNMFVDVFARMMKQYNAIASLVEEKIVY